MYYYYVSIAFLDALQVAALSVRDIKPTMVRGSGQLTTVLANLGLPANGLVEGKQDRFEGAGLRLPT